MSLVFLKILNMSITASYLALAVIVLRLLLKKAPKAFTITLWALVGIRLICPFSFESILSLIPSAETVPTNIIYSDSPAIQSGIPAINSAVNPIISETFSDSAGNSVNTMQALTFISSLIWIIGMALMLLYAAISYLRLYIKVREAASEKGNIWICDRIATPFILGIFKPRIFLPSDIDEKDTEYVIAHETAHLKRHDHFWKPLGFLILTVYWFNPVLWIGYFLLCKDIELACDEKVIREMGNEIKKPYSEALINCSVTRKTVSACPLAFGETDVKGRIKSVLSYKKPAFWVIAISVILCAAVTLGFVTNPVTDKSVNDKLAAFIDSEIADHHRIGDIGDNYYCLNWEVLGIKKSSDKTTVYMWVLYTEYSYDKDLKVEKVDHIPAVITVAENNNKHDLYDLYEYWEPTEGPYYEDYIKDKFPRHLRSKALDPEQFIDKQTKTCEKMAKLHFGLISIADGYETSLSYTNYSESSKFYIGSLNFHTMGISSVQHLPIYKFESEREIEEFKNKFADDLEFSSWYNEIPSFNKVMRKYDSEFFESNVLLSVFVSVGSGSFRFGVSSIDIDEKNLCIHIKEIKGPALFNNDKVGWFVTVEMPRSDIENVTSFDADLIDSPAINFDELDNEDWKDDEWGLSMAVKFKSDTEFDVYFIHNSRAVQGQMLETSSKYEIFEIRNGNKVSLEHYIEENYKDSDAVLCWIDESYGIPYEGGRIDSYNLRDTYGELPPGDYVLCKEVVLRNWGDVTSKVYCAPFSIHSDEQ